MNNTDLEALLAQLRESQDISSVPPALESIPAAPTTTAPLQAQLDALLSSLQPTQSARSRDLTALSFQESIPVLQTLARSDGFLGQVVRLRDAQDKLEVQLKAERDKLESDCKRKGLSAAGQSSHLRIWARDNALKQWADLRSQQQRTLQELGVPTFYRTRDPAALKKQARVMSVLLGFLDDEHDERD